MSIPTDPNATTGEQTPAGPAVTEQAAPCCGTRAAADAAGACCDPAAKQDAVAAGASCCG